MNARAAPLHPVIRPLDENDIDALIRIEEATYPWPWTRGIFADCIRVGYYGSGLVLGSNIAGYCFLNWIVGECHLLNICIHPDWQGRGFGSMLLDDAFSQARQADCHTMFLEVRPSNPGAIRLYRRRGFHEIGLRPAYYRAAGGKEDAIVMQLDLAGS